MQLLIEDMMYNLEKDYSIVLNHLKSLNFHFLESWVFECVSYYKETDKHISSERLKEEVVQQWLLLDLKDFKIPSLPPNLAVIPHIILRGKYAVQVESMVDIGRSYYSQLQKLRNVETVNVEHTSAKSINWEPPTNRCLLLHLNDGVQEIKGMEYQPISSLQLQDSNLLPGFKVIIIGPVVCRRGMLLLKQENIKVCGGEVDSLVVINSLENVLCRELGVEENPNVIRNVVDIQNQSHPDEIDNLSNRSVKVGNNDSTVSDQSSIKKIENTSNLGMSFDDFDNDDFLNSEMDFFEQTCKKDKSTFNNNELSLILDKESHCRPSLNQSEHLSVSNLFQTNKSHDYGNASHFERSNKTMMSTNVPIKDQGLLTSSANNVICSKNFTSTGINERLDYCTKASSCSSKTKVSKDVQTKLSDFYASTFPNMDNRMKTTQEKQLGVKVNPQPYIYLKQIETFIFQHCKLFKVKAEILTIKNKLALKNGQFLLKANICDGSLTMDVNFSSYVLENLLGFSACEMQVMIKEKSQNSAIAGKIKKAFEQAQQKLITLNCILKIRFFPDKDTAPLVVAIKEITEKHLTLLKNRQINTISA